MFPTYQQVPYVLRHVALVANRPPLLRTVQLLHSVTIFENHSHSSVAAPAARARQVPLKLVQAISATTRPVVSCPLGLADSRLASATPIQAAVTPLTPKAKTDTNCDRVDEVMLNRIDVKSCDS